MVALNVYTCIYTCTKILHTHIEIPSQGKDVNVVMIAGGDVTKWTNPMHYRRCRNDDNP